MTGLSLERPPSFGPVRIVAVVAGVLLALAAWWQVGAADDGITQIELERAGVPITLILPEVDGDADPVPGVVVAHGFSGSRELMRSFGLALAGAGYAVAMPDLAGHGANLAPLDRDDDRALVRDVEAARAALLDRAEVDGDLVALLGHSMGSGAVLRAGLADPDAVVAVIAVSPTDAEVTPDSPPNLFLLAGAREPRFVANAEDLLERAGGPSDDIAAGTARALEVIPSVEHISILFSGAAHRSAVGWLDAVTGRSSEVPTVTLMIWWLAHLVAVLVVWRALLPVLVTTYRYELDRGRPLVGLAGGGIAATLVLAVVGSFLDLGAIGGMLVGPALGLWFAVAGAVWLRFGPDPGRLDGRGITWAVTAFVVLFLAFGAMAGRVWLPWLPTGRRVLFVPGLALLVLPWTLALGATLQGRRGARAFGWWVAVSVAVLVALGAAATVVPGIGFVMLVLPLLPAVIGLLIVVWSPIQRPWAAGLAGAGFLGWTLAVLFPLT